jgi:hypothetical protein
VADELSSGELVPKCKEALERINRILEELEKPINMPSKEQVLEQLERMFSELEEGKIIYSPSVRNRFEIDSIADKKKSGMQKAEMKETLRKLPSLIVPIPAHYVKEGYGSSPKIFEE